MTKQELLAAIAQAPDEATIYVITPDGVGHKEVMAYAEYDDGDSTWGIFVALPESPDVD